MMTKIGLHIGHPDGLNHAWVDKFQSRVHLVLALNIGGEIPMLQAVAHRCPNSLLIYRAYSYGGLGQSDHFENYYPQHGADPLPLIQAHEPCFSAFRDINHRVAYQLWNETGDDDNSWAHFVEFNTNYIREMDKRGLSAAVLGTGPGRPSGTREQIRAKWEIARPMFEAINQATHPHYLNMHEYIGYPHTQWTPFLCGRYAWLLEDLTDMGLLTDKIRLFAGEIGWADPKVLDPKYPPNPANGYRGFLMLGITPQQLAADLHTAFQTVYTDPHFIGSCIFTYGAYGWEDFDLLKEPAILEEIVRLQEVTPVPEPTPIIVTETPVMPFQVTNGPLNVRQAPSISALKVGSLAVGVTVQTNGYVEADGIRWRRLAEQVGYCAEYVLGEPSAPFLTKVEPPDWKIGVLAQIEALRAQLAQLEASVRAA